MTKKIIYFLEIWKLGNFLKFNLEFFLFSYSYDVTRSLQYNLAPYYGLPKKFCDYTEEEDVSKLSEDSKSSYQRDLNNEDVTEDAKDLNFDQMFNFSSKFFKNKEGMELSSLSANIIPDMVSVKKNEKKKKFKTKVFRGIPTEKFVWNSYILEELKDKVHPDWLLNIIHGFVGQSSIYSLSSLLIFTNNSIDLYFNHFKIQTHLFFVYNFTPSILHLYDK